MGCPLSGDGSFKPADASRLHQIFSSVYQQLSGQLEPNKALTGCVMFLKYTY